MRNNLFKILLLLISFNLTAQTNNYKWSDPVNLSELNTEGNDFAPSWNKFEDVLFFNSDISKYSKFYSAKLIDKVKFSEPKLVAGDINQSRNNQSYITFESRDDAYISTFRLAENRSYLNIYQTRYRKMSWNKPVLADSLQFDAFTSHPTVSPDGTIMIFSSDRNSEHKETDLWMAFKQDNGSWGSVINLSELNSPGNEITPYLASKDTLYFASDGQEGPGGFDMFMSVYENGTWGRPFPLSELNTSYNESDITLLPTGEIIFASDRPGGKGKLDLYISKPEEKKLPIDSISENIEISLAAQVLSIQSKKVNSTQTYFIPNFILNNSLEKNKEFNLFNNPDSIFNLIPMIIGKRMSDNPSANLNISCSGGSLELANQLKTFLEKGYNVSDNRIKIDSNSISTNNQQLKSELLFLESTDKNIFRPLEATAENISLSPPVLELTIDARPRKEIKKWNCSLITKNNQINYLNKGDSLPAEFTLNLSGFNKEIEESDSVVIRIEAEDKFGKTHSNELTLNINHSSIKESNSIKIYDKTYQQYIVFAYDKESVAVYNSTYKNLISKLKEISVRKVIVQYSIQNNGTVATAEAITSTMKKENINAKTEFMNITSQKVSDLIKPYLFRILVE